MSCGGLLHLLASFMALNLVHAKHYLVETEHKEELFTEKQINTVLRALPEEAKLIYNSLTKSAQQTIQKKLHELYGNDTKAVRYTIAVTLVICFNYLKNKSF